MLSPRIRNRRYLNLYDFKEVAPGKFTVRRSGGTYRIEGGKRLGGSTRDWFLSGPGLDADVPCKSIVDALRLVDGL